MADEAVGLAGEAPQVAPNAQPQGLDMNQILQVLAEALRAAVDQNGFVDIQKLVQIWPQIAQAAGLSVPFEIVLQMIGENPEILIELVNELGLAGITVDGRQITGEELGQMGGGGSTAVPGPMGGGAEVGGAAGMAGSV